MVKVFTRHQMAAFVTGLNELKSNLKRIGKFIIQGVIANPFRHGTQKVPAVYALSSMTRARNA